VRRRFAVRLSKGHTSQPRSFDNQDVAAARRLEYSPEIIDQSRIRAKRSPVNLFSSSSGDST
jgi:hypothetical protein